MTEQTGDKAPSLLDVTKSVLAAFLGVQSNRNYERDFKHGKAWQFIVVGLLGVGVFIAMLLSVVMIVLNAAGM